MKEKVHIHSQSKNYLADKVTPVGLYLKFRDKYNGGLLLESSDYQAKENSYSFLCFNPLVEIEVDDDNVILRNGEFQLNTNVESNRSETVSVLQQYLQKIEFSGDDTAMKYAGLFGYTSYDAIPYFEKIDFNREKTSIDMPFMQYAIFRIVIVINHFNNELTVVLSDSEKEPDFFKEVEVLIQNNDSPSFSFESESEEYCSTSPEEFKEMVRIAKTHCKRGDVFQLVLSRRFSQSFKGDEFNVYRALRSINPSPYLFYFDYGNFKIFGSSPEAQLIINNGTAQIHPIAGTYRRTGDDEHDREAAIELSNDPKENAEHVMLVDLARNDLSRNTKDVYVDTYKEIQYFSHVIHLVSKVEGRLEDNRNNLRIFADTFPAGTLSGAPKYKAMELIDKYEKENRGYYGGAIGFLKINGELNHAIMIRSFLSKNNTLYYQAGAGIVIGSDEESELQEVTNKSEALRKAVQLANQI